MYLWTSGILHKMLYKFYNLFIFIYVYNAVNGNLYSYAYTAVNDNLYSYMRIMQKVYFLWTSGILHKMLYKFYNF